MVKGPRSLTALLRRQCQFGVLVVALGVVSAIAIGIKSFRIIGGAAGLSAMKGLLTSPAVAALYGKPYGVSTAGGFTQWKMGMYLALAVTTWITLLATKLSRGAEDDGSWDLLVTGRTTHRRATATVAASLVVTSALLGFAAAACFVAAGESVIASGLYGATLGLLVATFAMLGLLSAQLFAPRRRASSCAAGVLMATFVMRMVADGVPRVSFLRWATPFGWFEEVRCFDSNRWWVLALFVLVLVVVTWLTVATENRRDVGQGLFARGDVVARPHALVGSVDGMIWTQRRGLAGTWVVVVALFAALMGLLIKPLVDFAHSNPSYVATLQHYGYGSMVTSKGFVGEMGLFFSVAFAFLAVTSLHQLFADEGAGRLDIPLATGVARRRWLDSTVSVTTGILVVTAALSALAFAAGSFVAGGDVSTGDFFQAAASSLVFSIPVCGFYVALLGWVPRAALGVTSGAIIVTFVVAAFGPALHWPEAVLVLSPLHHLPLVPLAPWAPSAVIGMLGVGVVLGVLGIFGYERRDLLSA